MAKKSRSRYSHHWLLGQHIDWMIHLDPIYPIYAVEFNGDHLNIYLGKYTLAIWFK